LVLFATSALASGGREEALFLFELNGAPVGTVRLAWEPTTAEFRYHSTQLFRRGTEDVERSREEVLSLDAKGEVVGARRRPAALWLWKGPPGIGCVAVLDERTRAPLEGCVERRTGERVEGTLGGQRMEARYSERGLEALALPGARFTRIASGARLAPREWLVEGLTVAGGEGPLTLEPPLASMLSLRGGVAGETKLRAFAGQEARAVARSLRATPVTPPTQAQRTGARDGSGAAPLDAVGVCLAQVQRFVQAARARGAEALRVDGLVVDPEDGRAYPHAWVRVRTERGALLDLDPTLAQDVTPATHLVLSVSSLEDGARGAGEAWLALLRGGHRVVRRPSARAPVTRPSKFR
jgi:hypothetical protein